MNKLSEDQIKDMMVFVLGFYQAVKHINMKSMAMNIKLAAEYLKVQGFSPLEFKKTVEELNGAPMPGDDKFYESLVNKYKEIENEKH